MNEDEKQEITNGSIRVIKIQMDRTHDNLSDKQQEYEIHLQKAKEAKISVDSLTNEYNDLNDALEILINIETKRRATI